MIHSALYAGTYSFIHSGMYRGAHSFTQVCTQEVIHSGTHSGVHLFIHSGLHTGTHSFLHSGTYTELIHSFTRARTLNSFIPSLGHTWNSLIHSLRDALGSSSIHSLRQARRNSFIHCLGHAFTHNRVLPFVYSGSSARITLLSITESDQSLPPAPKHRPRRTHPRTVHAPRARLLRSPHVPAIRSRFQRGLCPGPRAGLGP